MITHDFDNPPPCPNNPDKSRTNDNGHLFQDAWNDPRAVFDRAGFKALEICLYCGLWAAAKRPNDETEAVSYFAADNDSKAWAMINALDLQALETAVRSSGGSLVKDGILTLTTEDFSLNELELAARDARDFGYHVAGAVLDEYSKAHRMTFSIP